MACGAGLYVEAVLATVIVLLSLQFVGALEGKLGWKHYPMLYEVRGTDQSRMYVAILSVLDRLGIRLRVLEKESIAELERVTFVVSTNRSRHALVLESLRAADAADEVIVFHDEEEE